MTAGILAGGIPKVMHRIWLGGPMPRRIADFGRQWADLHAHWEVRTWREWDLPALRHQIWFDRAPTPAGRADIARLELLYRFGGVYIDADFEPLRPLDELIERSTCFIGREDDHWMATGLFGAVPGHPFVARLLDELPQSILDNSDAPPNVQSGPQFVTRLYLESSPELQRSISVFPPAVFYPYHFSEPERAGGPFPDAYAVHHWTKSWGDEI